MERENDFGVFAVMYVKQLIEVNERPSIDGWKNFIYMQTKNENKANKGCPRTAFLGLCEEGYIKNIPVGMYLNKVNCKNKQYAIAAIEILKKDDSLKNNPKKLWELVPNHPNSHNGQMNVVCSLWNANLIVK